MSLPELQVYIGAPDGFVPRAAWALTTMLAPLGRRVRVLRDAEQAAGAALAYAPAPLAGVPTIPCAAGAMAAFAAGEPLAPGSFTVRRSGHGFAVGAFAADPDAGFAVPFDLVASAFALLCCWDERTSAERDKHGRLPLSASVFAANPALSLDEPEVDRYVTLLRSVLTPRLAELGLEPLPPAGWVWAGAGGRGDEAADGAGGGTAGRDGGSGPVREGGARFAVALTHDLDNLWRWTPRGFAAAGYRSARALKAANGRALRRELGDVADWLVHHLPRGTDPFWTFPQILEGEDSRSVSSSFYVIARHTHANDGNQPETYRRRLPAALRLLRHGAREVGLHGNDADRLGAAEVTADRDLLTRHAGVEVTGIRYHYLRALYHETLPFLESAGFTYDTSLAFAEREGYRCGCSFPFRPYSLVKDRPLRLVELPLAVMDGTLQEPHYRGLAAADAEHAAASVLARALRSGGAVALLWHNNRFDPRVSRGYDAVYWRLLDQALAHGAVCGRAADIVARWVEATS